MGVIGARGLALRISVVSCALACGLVSWGAPALASRGHAFGGAFGEPCSVGPCGPGQLDEPSGVAVNEATGEVYVLDQGDGRVERFSSTGAYEAQFDGSETPAKAFAFGAIPLPAGIAVDNSCFFKKLSAGDCSAADPSDGDVYVTDPGNGVVDKFSREGVYLGQLQEASGEAAFKFEPLDDKPIDGVGVDANGMVWVYQAGHTYGVVDSFTDADLNTFIASGELRSGSLGGFNNPGFAVDGEDDLYARRKGEIFTVTKFSGSGLEKGEPPSYPILVEPFYPEETSAVAVDLSSGEVFLDNVGSVSALSTSGSLEERIGAGILVNGSGLAVSHANESVYVVDAATSMVDIFAPEPPSKPTVQGESVVDVTGNSATFGAEINPRGGATEYHFEYGRCTTLVTCASSAYEESAPVPDGPAGSDFEVHSVSAHRQDLLAGTVYHFRVVVHNQFDVTEPVDGEERIFTTQTASGQAALPDGRAWEMVSPPQKQGALIESTHGDLLEAAMGGDALAYVTRSPTEADPQGYAKGVPVLSLRGPEGWASRDIAIPHEGGVGPGIGSGLEYRFFSEDLSSGVVQPFGSFIPASSPLALSPREASEQTAFLHTNYLHGDINDLCAESCFRPLVTGMPGYANVPEGTPFGEEGRCPLKGVHCGPEFVGASPDSNHVVLTSAVPLVRGANSDALYEWTGGKLSLVSVLPESETPAPGPRLGFGLHAAGAVSDDGSRIEWTSGEGHLYSRDTVRGETVKLDAPEAVCLSEGKCGGGQVDPGFVGASSDGSRVFFTDTQDLTGNSGGSSSGPDLYECEIVEVAGRLQCKLSDLTPLSSGEKANVQGVAGVSKDGSWVYFVANGVLAPGGIQGKCAGISPPGVTCNLYVWHAGTTRLVAVLSGEDGTDWAGPARGTARVSPDGQWLAFMSQQELTGYDTHDASSGKLDEEVYLYDGAGAGRLACASCNPTGARPAGILGGILTLVDGPTGRWFAASIPPWTQYVASQGLYQSRYLSDSGRLFFNSSDSLAPRDVNGREDVYEYEPPGVGDCATASVTFSERSGGCVGLISSGTSAEESAFMDASEGGGDVFFATQEKLASQDFDTAFDVYDARECTSSSPCLAAAAVLPPECSTADGCRAAPTPQPPIFGSPSSATFSGAGNISASPPAVKARAKPLTRARKLGRALRACHAKKDKRKRNACEYRARKNFGAKAKSRKGAK